MLFLWALCGVPFGTYAIVQNFNIPLQVQPQIFISLCLVGWAQTLIYSRNWSAWKASAVALSMACLSAGFEAALILTLRPIYDRGDDAPAVAVGVVAAVLITLGLLPPYGEIWKRRGRVIGINWVFLCMDFGGAFFSLMALVAQETFDIFGGILYIICGLLEIGIFTAHLSWLFRTRRVRKAAAAASKTFDDVAAEHAALGIPFDFAEREPLSKLWGRRKRARQADEEKGTGPAGGRSMELKSYDLGSADARGGGVGAGAADGAAHAAPPRRMPSDSDEGPVSEKAEEPGKAC